MTDAMSAGAGSDLGDTGARSAGVIRVMGWFDRWGVLLMVAIMALLSWLAQPDVFLSERNIFNIFRQTAFYQMLALGQFIVIVTAGIDLSIGSVLALSMMCAAILADGGAAWPLVMVVPLLVGFLVGSVNGLGLTKLHMPHPFIMTLGMMFVARGATYLISGGRPITGMPPEVTWLGSGNIEILGLHIPVSLVIVVIMFVIAWFFLQHLRTGRHIFALGGNPQAARVSGINVDRTLVIAYALCGFMAGFAGLLLAGRTNSGFPNAGEGDELVAISAVIIGGASFFGGRGTVLGVFAGVLVIGMLRNLLNLSNVQVFWQQVLIGVVII
ncbi:MAG TPA: ABC transporter permease, partial [Candidatus Deferrimicrobium sp.]|nr:ABC transporter permease [Candidatus Deferrimicrobium sp.]